MMGRFSLDKTSSLDTWSIFDAHGAGLRGHRAEAIELRDLLLREFPVESQSQPQATDWPDPDEVRRALESTERLYAALNCDEGTLWRSAREWLRLREQPAPDVYAIRRNSQELAVAITRDGKDVLRLADYDEAEVVRVVMHLNLLSDVAVRAQDYRLPRTMSVIRNALNGPSPAEAVADLLAIARESGRMEKQAQIDAAVNAYRKDMHECEQIAGRALGYPRYCDDQQNFPEATDADGVCVGAHVAPTIVAELAEKYRAAMSELVRWRNTAANQMIQEAVAREREEHPVLRDVLDLAEACEEDDDGQVGGLEHMGDVRRWFLSARAQIRARSAKGVS